MPEVIWQRKPNNALLLEAGMSTEHCVTYRRSPHHFHSPDIMLGESFHSLWLTPDAMVWKQKTFLSPGQFFDHEKQDHPEHFQSDHTTRLAF
jgi:hypothetical protein